MCAQEAALKTIQDRMTFSCVCDIVWHDKTVNGMQRFPLISIAFLSFSHCSPPIPTVWQIKSVAKPFCSCYLKEGIWEQTAKKQECFPAFNFQKPTSFGKLKQKTDINLEDCMMNKKSPEQKVNLQTRWWQMEGESIGDEMRNVRIDIWDSTKKESWDTATLRYVYGIWEQ